MPLMLNRRINRIVFLDPNDGMELASFDKEEAVDWATKMLNLAGQITDEKEPEDA